MRKFILPAIAIACLLLSLSFVSYIQEEKITEKDRVSVVLAKLGVPVPSHVRLEIDPEQARIGKELSLQAWATVDGKKSRPISKYFLCTDCHNQVIEDVDLTNPNPEDRLRKSVKENLPFLQGTTFYGSVNRKSWYNEDYFNKYGLWIEPARDTLENAIQMCAKVCSSGRYLDPWELEAMVHYYNTLDYKFADIDFKKEDYEKLNNPKVNNEEKIALIESKYLSYSPATFVDVPEPKDRGLGKNGDPVIGKQIYVQSCMWCHDKQRDATSLKLDTNKLSLNYFKATAKKNVDASIYNIVLDGTKSEFAIRAYMPHYTDDRMSVQQLEDLVSYIMSEKP